VAKSEHKTNKEPITRMGHLGVCSTEGVYRKRKEVKKAKPRKENGTPAVSRSIGLSGA
jgi:hypothetical protein